MNHSDPFGERVCFRGSKESILRQRAATERATGTTFDLDDDNCAKNVVIVGPVTDRATAFKQLAESREVTIYVRWSLFRPTQSRLSSGTLATGDLVLIIDLNRFALRFGKYYTHDARGNCEKNSQTRNTEESMTAHEFGHPAYQLGHTLNPDAAMDWENEIHHSQGRPRRYACGTH